MFGFNYFNIPTRIIQGYESYTHLQEFEELSKKRVIMVTDEKLMKMGAMQQLRRYIESISYGLIFYELPERTSQGFTTEILNIVRNSCVQTVIGFGSTNVLAVARAIAQFGSFEKEPLHYIEIPSLPCIYTGLFETYYTSTDYETLKKPYRDAESRAKWLILDSSFTEYMRVEEILQSSAYSLAFAFDALLSRNVSMLSESYALKSIELIVSSGNRLPNEPMNIKLKNELLLGSLLASFAVQSSNLGISAGLGMALENTLICTEAQGAPAVLMSSLEYSLLNNLDKFVKIARTLNVKEQSDPMEMGLEVLNIIKNLLIQMEIKPLSVFDYTSNTLDIVAKQASRYDFMLELARPAAYYELLEVIKNATHVGIDLSPELRQIETTPYL